MSELLDQVISDLQKTADVFAEQAGFVGTAQQVSETVEELKTVRSELEAAISRAADVTKDWKDWHLKLSNALECKFLSRGVTLETATKLKAQLSEAHREIERLESNREMLNREAEELTNKIIDRDKRIELRGRNFSRLSKQIAELKEQLQRINHTAFDLAHYCDTVVTTMQDLGYSSRSEGLKRRMLAVSRLTGENPAPPIPELVESPPTGEEK